MEREGAFTERAIWPWIGVPGGRLDAAGPSSSREKQSKVLGLTFGGHSTGGALAG